MLCVYYRIILCLNHTLVNVMFTNRIILCLNHTLVNIMCLLQDYIMFKPYPCECNVFTNRIILCLNHTLVNVMCLLTGLYYV